MAEDNRRLFADLSIAAEGANSAYMMEQGKYPVIFLSFGEVKLPAWAYMYKLLCSTISAEYDRFRFLEESDRLSPA